VGGTAGETGGGTVGGTMGGTTGGAGGGTHAPGGGGWLSSPSWGGSRDGVWLPGCAALGMGTRWLRRRRVAVGSRAGRALQGGGGGSFQPGVKPSDAATASPGPAGGLPAPSAILTTAAAPCYYRTVCCCHCLHRSYFTGCCCRRRVAKIRLYSICQ